MSTREMPVKGEQPQATTQVPDAAPPFVAEIKGELRVRLFEYARKRGRSAAGALRWLLHLQLKEEGF